MKSYLKKLFLVLTIIIGSLSIIAPLVAPNLVYAEEDVCSSNVDQSVKDAAGCSGNEDLVGNIIINMLYIVIFVVGVVSVIYIVVGGVKYMSSRGDPNATQTAKKTILYALIGLIITSLAFIIVNFSIGVIYGNGAAPGSSNYEGPDPSEQKPKLDDNNEITQITINTNKKNLYIGDSETIRAHITPVWLAGSKLTWKSSDSAVLAVDENGEITPKKEGTATITVTSENGKSDSITITVTKPIEPESVALGANTVNLAIGKTYTMKVTVFPTNANHKHITWSSSNSTIASVNARGQITGKKEGTANITARTDNGKTATAVVKVTEGGSGPIQINQSLLSGLDKYYQTNYRGGSVSCASAGDVSGSGCGLFAYMAARYVLTRQDTNAQAFAEEACNRWYFGGSSTIDKLKDQYKTEYEQKYGLRIKAIANTWEASVAELKKGHAVIYLVPPTPQNVINQNGGWYFTLHGHYLDGIAYREQNGGQIYIWHPVPGSDRNIGNCSKGECWYNKTIFTRNITGLGANAWSAEKVSK